MQLVSKAILLLVLSLLVDFSHCSPLNHGETNDSTNGRKTKNNPSTPAGVLSSVTKGVTCALAVTAAGIPGADCAPRQFGYGKQAETALNSFDAASDLPLAQPAPPPAQSFSPHGYTSPPGQQEMRRRITMNKPINAVQHRGGGGGHGGGGGGHGVGGGGGGHYIPGGHANFCTSNNCNDDDSSGCCC
ncbi:hypothetical protein niasHS_016242 [Heterodera schachtii]|uniref:Uncharacterized protein n=1 Tax=Heterodera schachtii TaxID=97005 RepID=A0ABD2HNR6_HETSC